MKKFLFVVSFILTMTFILTGCGFNQDQAKKDSRAQLDKFLSSYKNGEKIGKANNSDQLNSLIDKKFKKYFTTDYLEKTHNINDEKDADMLETELFYLTSSTKLGTDEVYFFNDFFIEYSGVNKEKQTVTYKLTPKKPTPAVITPFHVVFKQENGKWKIDNVYV